MKSFFGFARHLFVCLLCTTCIFVSYNGNAQAPNPVYLFESSNPQLSTDVTAYLMQGKNNDHYILQVNNPSRKKLKILFYARGNRYTYRASDKTIAKRFDFKGADDGIYKFEVWDGKSSVKRNLQVKTYYATMREVRVIPAGKDGLPPVPKMVRL